MIDLEVEISLNRSYGSPFLHLVAYRQFSSNVYRKFQFDLWEDVCNVNRADGNVFLKILKGKMSGYNNVFQDCPYTPGIYFIRMKRMLINTLNFGQILPSGRYRVEFTITENFKGTDLFIFKLFVSISDLRIEKF